MSDETKIVVRVWARGWPEGGMTAGEDTPEHATVTYSDTPENLKSCANTLRQQAYGPTHDYDVNVADSIDLALASGTPELVVIPDESEAGDREAMERESVIELSQAKPAKKSRK